MLKVGPDSGVITVCRAGQAPPVRAENGYVTSGLQQVLVVDLKRCDDIHVDSHEAFGPLFWAISKVRD